jgi:hypothetical protein
MAAVDTVTDAADTVTGAALMQDAELTAARLAATLAEQHAVMQVARLEADTAAAQHAADSLGVAEPVAGSVVADTAVAVADTGNT